MGGCRGSGRVLESSRFCGGWRVGVGARGVMGKVGGGDLVQQECGPDWVEDDLVVGGSWMNM